MHIVIQPRELTEIRLRTRLPAKRVQALVGKVVGDDARAVLLQGPCRVLLPGGEPLAVYLPGAMPPTSEALRDALRRAATAGKSNARILAAGAGSIMVGQMRRSARYIKSSTIGYLDYKRSGMAHHDVPCRMTHWTGLNIPHWDQIRPLTEVVSEALELHVPKRYKVQKAHWDATPTHLRIPNSCHTTLTVNDTYETGVHKDSGDLEAGFSAIAVVRRGRYTGGILTFPEWRVGVDMQDRDLILMDAHAWHGNTAIRKLTKDAERLSVVSYFRTNMTRCPTTGLPA